MTFDDHVSDMIAKAADNSFLSHMEGVVRNAMLSGSYNDAEIVEQVKHVLSGYERFLELVAKIPEDA